jgi:hypothetical protein
MLKFITYFLTIAFAMFFAFWELRLKHQLTDRASSPSGSPSELGVMNDLSERMNRERSIESLPKKARAKLRTVVVLKFLFVAILIVEVIVLQRPK